MNFILFWIPRIGNYIMVMGIFLLVGSLDFGNRYVVIKYLGKEIILLPRNRLWTLDVVFRQIEIVLKYSTAFFILMNCLDVCV